MIDNYRLIDIIESANDRRPFCECGRPTEPVYRDGVVWLECSSLRDAPHTRLARMLAPFAALAHVHEQIVELPESGALSSAA